MLTAKQNRFQEQIRALPAKPGVYLMRDDAGSILYVGKAANLSNRVRSYFGAPHGLTPKLQKMVSRVADFEFIVTNSEQEAVILECTLIKRYRPGYNVRLKDDKSYPYLKINLNDDWPQVLITRRLEQDGARYFGPFASASSVRKTLSLVKKLFPYRSCNRSITGTDTRPCLDYHIHRCVAPCIGAVTRGEYREVINQVVLFLEGRQELVVRELRHKMEQAAANLEFERAAILRDQLQAVHNVMQSQKVVSPTLDNEDVIGFTHDKDEACVQVFFIRSGKLIGGEHFVLVGTQDETPGQIMASFVKQFYDSAPDVPPLILLQTKLDEPSLIEEWLNSKREARVKLRVPRRGGKRELVEMAAENARQILEQLRVKWLADAGKTAAAIDELEEQLQLPRAPRRIECYDISDIGGTSAVGSMVVFENGRPKRSHYRRFKIKTVAGADDYAMMREVLRRRFKRGGAFRGNGSTLEAEAAPDIPKPSTPWALTPDLVLIDGGRGQLNAALEVMRDLEIISVPVASLAKENEEVFIPEMVESIMLSRNSQALYLLQRMRDEAHRFALAYHHKVRRRTSMTSALDGIPGIGPKRKRALLRKFGSVKGVREASLDELAAAMGMTHTLAKKVKEYL